MSEKENLNYWKQIIIYLAPIVTFIFAVLNTFLEKHKEVIDATGKTTKKLTAIAKWSVGGLIFGVFLTIANSIIDHELDIIKGKEEAKKAEEDRIHQAKTDSIRQTAIDTYNRAGEIEKTANSNLSLSKENLSKSTEELKKLHKISSTTESSRANIIQQNYPIYPLGVTIHYSFSIEKKAFYLKCPYCATALSTRNGYGLVNNKDTSLSLYLSKFKDADEASKSFLFGAQFNIRVERDSALMRKFTLNDYVGMDLLCMYEIPTKNNDWVGDAIFSQDSVTLKVFKSFENKRFQGDKGNTVYSTLDLESRYFKVRIDNPDDGLKTSISELDIYSGQDHEYWIQTFFNGIKDKEQQKFIKKIRKSDYSSSYRKD